MSRGRMNPLLLIPLGISLGLGVLAYVALNRETADELPSAFAGREAPALELPPLEPDAQGPVTADLTAPGIKLVNFWASWCGPCRQEHPILTDLAGTGVPIIGINYKDQADNALGFLAELGDPYTKIGTDQTGRTGIDWGIYGVPETFVIDGSGKVLLRHPGPITPEIFEERLAPLMTGD